MPPSTTPDDVTEPPARAASLVIINTGHGKGKSSSAFGVMGRGWARGWTVGVVQFVKSGKWKVGERKLADHLGIEWSTMGDGFTWESTDLDETAAKGRHAWELSRTKLASGDYDLLILDELTYAVTYGWVDVADVVAGITAPRPADQRRDHRARRGARAHRDRRHGHRDAQGEARLRPRHQGAQGDRVLIMADPSRHPSEADIDAGALRARPTPTSTSASCVWRFPAPLSVVSSAPLGGGLGRRQWVINAQVPHAYARLDPEVHLAELASARGLTGPGVGMLTAVDLRHVWREEDGGARVDVSVGITFPTWAAAPGRAAPSTPARAAPGTINIVGIVPERLSPAAMVNAVMSVTEAKAQALWDAGVPATGTASDAVCIVCPDDGTAHPFGGPRSQWGARLARAVHRAVLAGCRRGASGVITLVLGGARSGKSVVAERLAAELASPVTYVATLDVGDDADLAARVERHRARRPPQWRTVQAGAGFPTVLRAVPGSVLVDSLGPVGQCRARAMEVDAEGLCSALAERDGDTVVVSEEVGLSVHPSTEDGPPVPRRVGRAQPGGGRSAPTRSSSSWRAARFVSTRPGPADAQGTGVPDPFRRRQPTPLRRPWTGSPSSVGSSGSPWAPCGGWRDGPGRLRPRPGSRWRPTRC